MFLVRLIYCSTPTRAMTESDIADIVSVSKRNNKAQGISGVLCFDERFFLQLIEGPRDRINRLYAALLQDERHSDLVILDYSEIHSRSFGAWDMACICAADLKEDTVLRYVYDQDFTPYALSGDGALSLLKEIASEIRVGKCST